VSAKKFQQTHENITTIRIHILTSLKGKDDETKALVFFLLSSCLHMEDFSQPLPSISQKIWFCPAFGHLKKESAMLFHP